MLKNPGTFSLTKLYLIAALGFAVNVYFCSSAIASSGVNSTDKNDKTTSAVKCNRDKQTEIKAKETREEESTSFFEGLFGFDLPKIPFGNYILSAQKALIEKLSDHGAPDKTPACTKKQ